MNCISEKSENGYEDNAVDIMHVSETYVDSAAAMNAVGIMHVSETYADSAAAMKDISDTAGTEYEGDVFETLYTSDISKNRFRDSDVEMMFISDVYEDNDAAMKCITDMSETQFEDQKRCAWVAVPIAIGVLLVTVVVGYCIVLAMETDTIVGPKKTKQKVRKDPVPPDPPFPPLVFDPDDLDQDVHQNKANKNIADVQGKLFKAKQDKKLKKVLTNPQLFEQLRYLDHADKDIHPLKEGADFETVQEKYTEVLESVARIEEKMGSEDIWVHFWFAFIFFCGVQLTWHWGMAFAMNRLWITKA